MILDRVDSLNSIILDKTEYLKSHNLLPLPTLAYIRLYIRDLVRDTKHQWH